MSAFRSRVTVSVVVAAALGAAAIVIYRSSIDGPWRRTQAEAPTREIPVPAPAGQSTQEEEAARRRNDEAEAARLAADCKRKLNPAMKDFSGAVSSAQAALAHNPTDAKTLGLCYQCLGYGFAYLGDRTSAVKWFEKYAPYCTNDCAQIKAYIGK